MKEAFPSNNYGRLSHDTKKNMRKLGLTFIKIDSCIYGCMLYYKNDAHLQHANFVMLLYIGCVSHKKGENKMMFLWLECIIFPSFLGSKDYLHLIVLLNI